MKATKLALALLTATGISAIATPVMAYEAGDWLVRGRIVSVNLGVDTDTIHLNGASVANTGVTVDNDTIPELDITYMITRNIGAELILGYSEHTVTEFGVGLAGPDVIEANALPPTLLLQYHFAPDSNIRPYVGAGVNYTYFFNEDTQGTFADLGVSVNMESSWGLAAQAGVDVAINDDWFVNLDVKYIDMRTKANFSTGHSVELDLNPIVWGVGIGRSF